MEPTSDEVREIVRHDVDPAFLESFATTIAWEYSLLFDRIVQEWAVPDFLRSEEFGRQRAICAVKALLYSATKHGIPFDVRRIDCNGQKKLLIKAGRVILLQEPMLSTDDPPRASDYKRVLAEAYGITRQLELDLGDQPYRIHDWSGSVMAVLLHGARGVKFTREDKALGGVALGVPDRNYAEWVHRFDLTKLALYGFSDSPETETAASPDQVQRDEVFVPLKEKRDTGEAS